MNDAHIKARDFEKRFPRISELSRFNPSIRKMVDAYLCGDIGLHDLFEWMVLYQAKKIEALEWEASPNFCTTFRIPFIQLFSKHLDESGNPTWI